MQEITSDADRGYWARVRGGIDHIRNNPIIRRTVGTLACAALFGSVESVLGVVLAVRVLQVGSSGFGIMEAGMAFGAILGTVIILPLTKRIRREKVFILGLLGFGVVEASIGLFPTFSWVIAAYAISGVLNMAFLIPARSILMINTPSELRTRTFAAFGAVLNSAVLAGTMLGGALEKPLGVPTVFVLAGAAVFLVTISITISNHLYRLRGCSIQHAPAEAGAAL
jgi:MFS family permease